MTKLQITGVAMAVLMAASVGACQKTENAANSATTGAAAAVDTGKIADAVKADVDQLIADFNAHDATKATAHDASDFVGMFHGAPNTVGKDADVANTTKMFAANSSQHVTVSDSKVDVAKSGEMAVYRSSYVFTATDPATKKSVKEEGNYLAGYKQQPDGTWKIAWSVVSNSGPPPAMAAAPKS